jgi:response regulator NasT
MTSSGLAETPEQVRAACKAGDVDALVVGRVPTDRALEVVHWASHDADLPVVLSLERSDPDFVAAAAERGAFASVVGYMSGDWQSAFFLALARSGEYRDLQDAFSRRAVVERAKGILMARHEIDQQQAFELLRDHARRHSRRVVDVAESVIESHRLLHEGGADLLGQKGAG